MKVKDGLLALIHPDGDLLINGKMATIVGILTLMSRIYFNFHSSLSFFISKFFLFGLIFYIPVNSYGHVRKVSSPNHTFSAGKLEQADNQYLVHIHSLVTDNNPSWINGKKENGRRNYFMINLHESMGRLKIKLMTPGSAVRQVAAARHITDCALWPDLISKW